MADCSVHQLRAPGRLSVAQTPYCRCRRPQVECPRSERHTDADSDCQLFAEHHQDASDRGSTVSRRLGAILYYYHFQGQKRLMRRIHGAVVAATVCRNHCNVLTVQQCTLRTSYLTVPTASPYNDLRKKNGLTRVASVMGHWLKYFSFRYQAGRECSGDDLTELLENFTKHSFY